MSKIKDKTGNQYGELTVLSRAEDYVKPSGKTVRRWLCKCSCGNEEVIRGDYLE